MKHDIVYILRNDIDSNEVRYSIRSVVENFPFNSLWIYGGKTNDIQPDHYVAYRQIGGSRYARVTNTIREICKNKKITPDFWLFNDDFFILKKVDEFPTLYAGTLWERVERIRNRHGCDSGYSEKLRATAEKLKAEGYQQLDYALHCPMLINRTKALQTLEKFKGYPMFRSLYGNHHSIGGEQAKDRKIQNVTDIPGDSLFVSTSDKAYYYGKAGEYIRGRFNERSRYEI